MRDYNTLDRLLDEVENAKREMLQAPPTEFSRVLAAGPYDAAREQVRSFVEEMMNRGHL